MADIPSNWRPLKMLQVDADSRHVESPLGCEAGDRLWIEVIKQGRVVGIVDSFANDEGVPAPVLEKISSDFKDVQPSSPAVVASDELARASVVVPTLCRNPPELVRTVESLLSLDYPDFEIIVVDNRRGAINTPLPEFPGGERVRVLAVRRPGVSAARNAGIAMATGEFLAFTDDDAAVYPDWLRALGTRFALDPEVDAIAGLVLPMELQTAPQLWFEEFYGGFSPSFQFEKMSLTLMKDRDPMFPYAVGRFGAGCNMAFRRSALDRLGGFDLHLGGGTLAKSGEDLLLPLRLVLAGGTFAYEPAALVRHTHRRSEDEFMVQVFNYGVGLTALYTALIFHDPKQLLAMLRRVPVGLRHLLRSPHERSPSAAPSYPKKTLYRQILGMLYGPVAYLRSVIDARVSH